MKRRSYVQTSAALLSSKPHTSASYFILGTDMLLLALLSRQQHALQHQCSSVHGLAIQPRALSVM